MSSLFQATTKHLYANLNHCIGGKISCFSFFSQRCSTNCVQYTLYHCCHQHNADARQKVYICGSLLERQMVPLSKDQITIFTKFKIVPVQCPLADTIQKRYVSVSTPLLIFHSCRQLCSCSHRGSW